MHDVSQHDTVRTCCYVGGGRVDVKCTAEAQQCMPPHTHNCSTLPLAQPYIPPPGCHQLLYWTHLVHVGHVCSVGVDAHGQAKVCHLCNKGPPLSTTTALQQNVACLNMDTASENSDTPVITTCPPRIELAGDGKLPSQHAGGAHGAVLLLQ